MDREEEELMRKVARDQDAMKVVGAIVGMVTGCLLGLFVAFELVTPRHSSRVSFFSPHVTLLILIIGGLVGVVAGGAVGYFRPAWRSSV